eukprot:PhF_6_TR7279/c0_g1_i3/m.10870
MKRPVPSSRRTLLTLPTCFVVFLMILWIVWSHHNAPTRSTSIQQQRRGSPILPPPTTVSTTNPSSLYYTFNESIMTPYFLEHLWYMMNATRTRWEHGFWSAYDSLDISNCAWQTPECQIYLEFKNVDNARPYRKCCVEHLRLMETTEYVVKKLEENNVTYFLSTGSALGVFRHHNTMIPWDTDVDIAIKPESASLLKRIFVDGDGGSTPPPHKAHKDPLGKGMWWVHYSKDGIPDGGPHVEIFYEAKYTKHPEYLPLQRCTFYNLTVWCPNKAMLGVWFKGGWERYNSDHYHSDTKCLRYRLGEIVRLKSC